jgi:uncharacterized cupredoxin-like copper-binding protein
VSWYLASHPSAPKWQIGGIAVLAAAALFGGAIFAVVQEDEGEAAPVEEQVTTEPGEEAAESGSVNVGLTEFAVSPEPDTAPADTVSLTIANDGAISHNFRLIKTDLAPDALPKDGPQVDENAVDVLVSTSIFGPGESIEESVELDPGSYVLICNIPGHYDLGMRAPFTVE